MSDLLHTRLALSKPGWLDDFKAFILRGNVVDLAVGVVIGAAFTGIVNSLVRDLITPLLGLITGGVDFSNHFITLRGPAEPTLADGAESRRRDHQLRRVPEHGHQFPDHRRRDLLDDPAAAEALQGAAAALRSGADADGKPAHGNPRPAQDRPRLTFRKKAAAFWKKRRKNFFPLGPWRHTDTAQRRRVRRETKLNPCAVHFSKKFLIFTR